MRLIQHKQEAWWFYRYLSAGYDRWVNPLFWTPAMRDEALALARLDAPDLDVLDVGAGTGFTTEGVLARLAGSPAVTMLDQSPHQLARAARKATLATAQKVLGDAEALPFATDRFDRYVSAGSIEYWPEPQRAICEAYRVVKPGGTAWLAGPLPPPDPRARRLADAWMLFPSEEEYRGWFAAAGFADVEVVHVAPTWFASGPERYALAVAGRKPAPGDSPLAASLGPRAEGLDEPMGAGRRLAFAGRFVAGSAAGAAFVPLAAALSVRHRLRRAAG